MREFKEGLSCVRGDHIVLLLLFSELVIPLVGFPVQQLLPLLSKDVFHQGAFGFGLLSAMPGVGN